MKIGRNLYGRMDGSKFPENSLLCVILRYKVYVSDGVPTLYFNLSSTLIFSAKKSLRKTINLICAVYILQLYTLQFLQYTFFFSLTEVFFSAYCTASNIGRAHTMIEFVVEHFKTNFEPFPYSFKKKSKIL